MAQQYAIEDTTMTALADAVRGIVGEKKLVEIGSTFVGDCFISKTPNALSFTERDGDYATNLNRYDVVEIPGASKIVVDVAYQNEGGTYDYLQIASGRLTSMPSSATKYANKTLTRTQITFSNTDVITFYFRSDSSQGGFLGYYAECRGYDADGNLVAIYEKEYEEVPNTMTIEEITNYIDLIPVIDLWYDSGNKSLNIANQTFNTANASKLSFNYKLQNATSNTTYAVKWTLTIYKGYTIQYNNNNVQPGTDLIKVDSNAKTEVVFSNIATNKEGLCEIDVSDYTTVAIHIQSVPYTSGAYSYSGYLHLYGFKMEA